MHSLRARTWCRAGGRAARIFALVPLVVIASGTAAWAVPPGPASHPGAPGTVSAEGSPAKQATIRHVAKAGPQDAAGALSTVSSVTVHGGYTAAGIGMRNLGYGTISVTGVPAGATVKSATLLWDVLADQADPSFAQGSFDGTAITGTGWASGASPCWPVGSNFSYEADVTSLVTGNGSYSLSGFATGESDGADPWNVGSVPPLLEGASLVVVYQLASMPQSTIQIAEGATETDSGNSATATMNAFTATAPASAATTYIVADGQEAGNNASFNGTTLTDVGFPGADPQAVPDYSRGNLWDTVTTDVSSLVSPGDTSASLAVTGNDDCLVWVGQVLAVTGTPLRTLVAMGDSYSSGEANPPFDPGTNVPGDKCHRSAGAWPRLLATSDPTIAMEADIACSGAKTEDITKQAFNNEPPQIEQLLELPQAPQVITITIGGNDVGFKSVLENCFLLDCSLDHRLATAKRYIEKTLPGVLAATYNAILAAEPDSLVVVVGYPRLFPLAQAATHRCGWLTPTERTKLNGLATLLNSVIGTAARNAGFTYVSTLNALSGHEECQSHSWLYPIGDRPLVYDAHPTAQGQQVLAAVVRQALG
jgi:hypothetical protein